MRHTYLFAEGTWSAVGNYFDEQNKAIPVEGESVITHYDNRWVNDSFMSLAGGTFSRTYNKYEIVPFKNEVTEWRSFNPALGVLYGRFMVVSDTIISNFLSEDGTFTGVECLIKLDDLTYLGRGFAFRGNEKLSSWAVTLKAVTK